MPRALSGIYFDNTIRINKFIEAYEKTGVLAEEIGHYETTYGDILDLKDLRKKKLEVVARRWGYEKIVSLHKLIDCYQLGHRTIYDVCCYFEITDTYFENVLEFYKMKYGDYKDHEGYRIFFDPVDVKSIN